MIKLQPGKWVTRNNRLVEIKREEYNLFFGHIAGDIVERMWHGNGRRFADGDENPLDIIAPAVLITEEGVKYDDNKLPLHLLPFDALEAITEILAFGAKKYGERNWEKGMDWHRLFRAATGHLWSWFLRRGNDPETGKSHLWHAGCCILFLIAYELRGVGNDTRPN